MTTQFSYDVFLNYSPKDKPVARQIAQRLRSDGLNVWFDEWIIRSRDDVSAMIENGLERSRVLVLYQEIHTGERGSEVAPRSLLSRKSDTCATGWPKRFLCS